MYPFVIISLIFSVLYLWLVLFFWVGWLKLNRAFKKESIESNTATAFPFVSIIIPVRNEALHIQDCLKAIFAQSYPRHLYEVIVVDDYSTDSTLRSARELQQEGLTVLDLAKYFGDAAERIPNKKKAITIGVKNAKGQLIVTTDGDCSMRSEWLRTLVRYYLQHDYKFLTGPVLLQPTTGILGLFQQLDVANMLGITGGTIANGYPTMCNGANLLYERAAFAGVNGYKGNTDIPTGDDIFLMQKMEAAYPEGIGFVRDMEACVYSLPEATFSDFIAQRVRWTSKSTSFQKRSVTAILTFAYLFNLLILIFVPISFEQIEFAWLPLAIAFGTKIVVDTLFNISVLGFFKRRLLLLLIPVFEPLHIIYVVCIGVLGLSGEYKWKDRKVK